MGYVVGPLTYGALWDLPPTPYCGWTKSGKVASIPFGAGFGASTVAWDLDCSSHKDSINANPKGPKERSSEVPFFPLLAVKTAMGKCETLEAALGPYVRLSFWAPFCWSVAGPHRPRRCPGGKELLRRAGAWVAGARNSDGTPAWGVPVPFSWERPPKTWERIRQE